MTAKTTCKGCGKEFSYDDRWLSPKPASDGFLGGYICSSCEHDRNEERRHKERVALEERHRELEKDRLEAEIHRRDAEQRAAEKLHREEEKRHREQADREAENFRQEERDRLVQMDLSRELLESSIQNAESMKLILEGVKSHKEVEQGQAAVKSAQDLMLAGLYDDALRSVLRGQEILGATDEVLTTKLEIAKRGGKLDLVQSVVEIIAKQTRQAEISSQEKYDGLRKLIEAVGAVHPELATELQQHIDAVRAEFNERVERERAEAARRKKEAERAAHNAAASKVRAEAASREAADRKSREEAALQEAAAFDNQRRQRNRTIASVVGIVIVSVIAWFYLTNRGRQLESISGASQLQSPKNSLAEKRRPEVPIQPNSTARGQLAGGAEGVPRVSQGDTWTFSVVSDNDPKRTYSLRRSVSSVSDTDIVLDALNLSNPSAKPRRLTYDREWGVKRTEEASGSGKEYLPAIQYFKFPLQPGTTWESESIEVGTNRKFRVSAIVTGWDRIQTPAGNFDTLKVVLKSQEYLNSELIVEAVDTSWYAPLAKRSVLSEEVARDIKTGKTSTRRLSLTQYNLSQ